MKAIEQELKRVFNTDVNLIKASDSANLLYDGYINNEKVCSIYKSFYINLNTIHKIKFIIIN